MLKNEFIENLNLKFQKNKGYYICITLALLISGFFALVLFNKTFALAEGWYTYYSQCINNGQILYKDFEYLFSPLYIKFIAFFTWIFGYKLIFLRVLGVLVFLLLTYFAFKTFSILFNPLIALVSSLTAVFYMQSEVVQIFYDYIRFMDMMVYISIFVLINLIAYIFKQNKKMLRRYSIYLACSVSAFILIKQNMGILFFAYICALFIFLGVIDCKNRENIFKSATIFILCSLGILAIGLILFVGIGNLPNFFNLALGGAASSKGGISAILFNWLRRSRRPGIKSILLVLFLPGIIFLLNYFFTKKKRIELNSIQKKIFTVGFAVFTFFGLAVSLMFKSIANILANLKRPSGWTIFICALLFLGFYLCKILYNFIKNKDVKLKTIQIFSVLGCIFAVAYGCGTSGGIAEGQVGFALGFILALFLYFSLNKLNFLMYFGTLVISSFIILSCASFKMIDTYSWWGLYEPSIWECNQETKIPLLSGIKVSKSTKIALESVHDTVNEYTQEQDPIFCFPQIPVLYSLCQRTDPGTFTKVQWFDVATDKSVVNDIKVIKEKAPKVILVQDIPLWVIQGHEFAFRGNKLSGLNTMQKEIYEFALSSGYELKGRYNLNNDHTLSILVKVKEGTSVFAGEGTSQNPYLIENLEQLCNFRDQVNIGRTFEGKYLKQTADIDLSSIRDWQPIAAEKTHSCFLGCYDGNGYNINNININNLYYSSNQNGSGFFGRLGGKIFNLGINGKINGDCCGSIAACSYGKNAGIYNCFSNVDIIANKAGGIAGDFYGDIINCVSYGNLNAKNSADIIFSEKDPWQDPNDPTFKEINILNSFVYSNFRPYKNLANVGYICGENAKNFDLLYLLNNYINCSNHSVNFISWKFNSEKKYCEFAK